MYYDAQYNVVFRTCITSMLSTLEALCSEYITHNLSMSMTECNANGFLWWLMQDLKSQAAKDDLQLSQAQVDNIIKALRQLTTALKAAEALVQKWVVPSKKNVWQAIQRFACSTQDCQELAQVSRCVQGM